MDRRQNPRHALEAGFSWVTWGVCGKRERKTNADAEGENEGPQKGNLCILSLLCLHSRKDAVQIGRNGDVQAWCLETTNSVCCARNPDTRTKRPEIRIYGKRPPYRLNGMGPGPETVFVSSRIR